MAFEWRECRAVLIRGGLCLPQEYIPALGLGQNPTSKETPSVTVSTTTHFEYLSTAAIVLFILRRVVLLCVFACQYLVFYFSFSGDGLENGHGNKGG